MRFWKQRQPRTLYVFVFVIDGNVTESRVVMGDYFNIPLFQPREDQRMDDNAALEMARKIWSQFVCRSGNDILIAFSEPYQVAVMPLGVGYCKTVFIRLQRDDLIRSNIHLQPIERSSASAMIRSQIEELPPLAISTPTTQTRVSA